MKTDYYFVTLDSVNSCSKDSSLLGQDALLIGRELLMLDFFTRDHWGDLGVDGWIILGWISRRWDVDWIGMAQDRDRWRTLVSAVMNFRVP